MGLYFLLNCVGVPQSYKEEKKNKSFAVRPLHLPNELAACHRDLTKLASVQEMMQGVIVRRCKGRKVSETLANDVANGPLTPTDRRSTQKNPTNMINPSHFLPPVDSLQRCAPSDQPTCSQPLRLGHTHSIKVRVLRRRNSSR